MENIRSLESYIKVYKRDNLKLNNEKSERLKEIMKNIVMQFKISKKSVEKIIDSMEK